MVKLRSCFFTKGTTFKWVGFLCSWKDFLWQY